MNYTTGVGVCRWRNVFIYMNTTEALFSDILLVLLNLNKAIDYDNRHSVTLVNICVSGTAKRNLKKAVK